MTVIACAEVVRHLLHWTMKLVNTSDTSCWLMRGRAHSGCDTPCCGLSVRCHSCISMVCMAAGVPSSSETQLWGRHGWWNSCFNSHFQRLHCLVKALHVIRLPYYLWHPRIWMFFFIKIISRSSDWNVKQGTRQLLVLQSGWNASEKSFLFQLWSSNNAAVKILTLIIWSTVFPGEALGWRLPLLDF